MSVYYVNSDGETVETQSSMTENMLQSEDSSSTEAQATLANFWPKVLDDITNITSEDFKHQALPLARIKKIMKLDGDVKMISAEAPMLFAKAAEIFINELTLRAWTHTEDNKRRTLQRNDIAMAITMYDQFDFLIDIVPRDELKPSKPREESAGRVLTSEQVHYYVQLAQQQNQAQQPSASQASAANAGNNSAAVTVQNVAMVSDAVQATSTQSTTTLTPPPSGSTATAPTQGIQIMQQIVTPSGELQHIPISLTPAQLNMIRMQMQNNSTQPIVLQAAPIQTSMSSVSGQPQILQVAQNNATSVYLTPASSISESD